MVAGSILWTGCNLVFGVEAGHLAGSGGSGAAGGVGGTGGGGAGGGATCPPEKPAECDPGLVDDGDNCCVEGRSCGNAECVAGECQSAEIVPGPAAGKEGVSVVVAGDYLLWSTGYGQSIHRTDLDGDGVVTVVSPGALGFQSVSMLAVDPGPSPHYLFFTDADGPAIGRAGVETGSPEILAVVPDALVPGAKAGLGRILVHGDFVYWAVDFNDKPAGSSSIWRAPREPAGPLPVEAELVVANDGAFGLAGDAEHLYFGDTSKQSLLRLAWTEIGKKDGNGMPVPAVPEVVNSAQDSMGDVAVDDDYVYWARYNEVRAQSKDATNGLVYSIGQGNSYVWGIVADGRDVYFSTVGDSAADRGAFFRARRAESGTAALLYEPEPPVAPATAKGISAVAGSCDSVFFLVHEDGAVRKLVK